MNSRPAKNAPRYVITRTGAWSWVIVRHSKGLFGRNIRRTISQPGGGFGSRREALITARAIVEHDGEGEIE